MDLGERVLVHADVGVLYEIAPCFVAVGGRGAFVDVLLVQSAVIIDLFVYDAFSSGCWFGNIVSKL